MVVKLMGTKPYTKLVDFDLDCESENIVVEIGSENGEGSSLWLHAWAKQHRMDFYSIDVEHRKRETDYPYMNWVVTTSGSDWCKNTLPGLDKKIKVLYLDNFDWIWDEDNLADYIKQQIQQYAQRGVVMNNRNCQEEHRLQVQYCLPYLDKQSVVIMDDTFYNNGIWNGKCATAIELLMQNGYVIKNNELATRGCE
jgi:hypothetical protein